MKKYYRIVDHNDGSYYTIQFRVLWFFWNTMQKIDEDSVYKFVNLSRAKEFLEVLKNKKSHKKTIVEKGAI